MPSLRCNTSDRLRWIKAKESAIHRHLSGEGYQSEKEHFTMIDQKTIKWLVPWMMFCVSFIVERNEDLLPLPSPPSLWQFEHAQATSLRSAPRCWEDYSERQDSSFWSSSEQEQQGLEREREGHMVRGMFYQFSLLPSSNRNLPYTPEDPQ